MSDAARGPGSQEIDRLEAKVAAQQSGASDERQAIVRYLTETLAGNHPHLADAYGHAAHNIGGEAHAPFRALGAGVERLEAARTDALDERIIRAMARWENVDVASMREKLARLEAEVARLRPLAAPVWPEPE